MISKPDASTQGFHVPAVSSLGDGLCWVVTRSSVSAPHAPRVAPSKARAITDETQRRLDRGLVSRSGVEMKGPFSLYLKAHSVPI